MILASDSSEDSQGSSLEEMQARHESIARYQVVRSDWKLPKGKQDVEVDSGLTYTEAKKIVDEGNARLAAEGKTGFAGQLYGQRLTNSWECLSEAARARLTALGKAPKPPRVG